MAKKLRIGDVLEIETQRGLAYAQYTHRNEKFGSLIRVLPGFFLTRPKSLADLVRGPSSFVVFYPVRAAISQKVAKVVINEPVPEHAREFPLFRSGTPDPITNKVQTWWFWDGERGWPVGSLTPEQLKMPIRMIVNHTGLVQLINDEWKPENDKS